MWTCSRCWFGALTPLLWHRPDQNSENRPFHEKFVFALKTSRSANNDENGIRRCALTNLTRNPTICWCFKTILTKYSKFWPQPLKNAFFWKWKKSIFLDFIGPWLESGQNFLGGKTCIPKAPPPQIWTSETENYNDFKLFSYLARSPPSLYDFQIFY